MTQVHILSEITKRAESVRGDIDAMEVFLKAVVARYESEKCDRFHSGPIRSITYLVDPRFVSVR